ncbi:MAG: sugar transferase [Synechocystis sp.]
MTLAGVDQHFTFAETTNQLVTDADEPEQGNRLEVKPGLTGEWQVNGRSTVLNFDQVVAMDLNYQKRWSLGYDLKLIFKTIQVVFSKRSGAC